MNASEKIKKLRKDKGVTSKKMAEAIGVSDGAVRLYESGRRIPRDDIKIKIAAYFNCKVGDIFYDGL